MTTPNPVDPTYAPPRRTRPGKTIAAAVLAALVGFAVGYHSPNTPDSCRQALAYADQGFRAAADGFTSAGDAVQAITQFDQAGVEAASVRMDASAEILARISPLYRAAKADCRGAHS